MLGGRDVSPPSASTGIVQHNDLAVAVRAGALHREPVTPASGDVIASRDGSGGRLPSTHKMVCAGGQERQALTLKDVGVGLAVSADRSPQAPGSDEKSVKEWEAPTSGCVGDGLTVSVDRSSQAPAPLLQTQPLQTQLPAGAGAPSKFGLPAADDDRARFLSEQRTTQQHELQARSARIRFRRALGQRVLQRELSRWKVSPPTKYPAVSDDAAEPRYQIDRNKQAAYSEFVRRSGMRLPDFVRLLRGESSVDPSPNKALKVPRQAAMWRTYRYATRWEGIVRHGVVPEWHGDPPRQDKPPRNHAFARRAMNALVKNIRKGQDADRYLVLDVDLLPGLDGVFCSPFGAVQKGDKPLSEDARVIHDLSFPCGGSINDFTVSDATIEIRYDGARAIASRIEAVDQQFPDLVRMMSGDVSGAFRHTPVHADHIGRFAGTIPELGILVIDLCCPFGWTNSPAEYWIADGAINHLHSSSRPVWTRQPACGATEFDGKVWCDDHNCVEPDIGSRLDEAAASLRWSMIQVLGPDACNEEKFTGWFTRGSALGLVWDLRRHTVSLPAAKIAKARQRVCAALSSPSASRTQLNRLLGSLRHVVTCIRPAGSFFQRIAEARRQAPSFGSFALVAAARDDLLWFRAILDAEYLNEIPLERFTQSQEPTAQVYMDASDLGLCALYPARREFLQIRFDEEEVRAIQAQKTGAASTFGINIRELMSVVYAALLWGSHWARHGSAREAHVRIWIDSTSAVA